MNAFTDKEVAIHFGEFIKAGRLKKGLSQVSAAELLEISQPYYHRIEAGLRSVDLVFAMRICQLFGLDLNDFVKAYNLL